MRHVSELALLTITAAALGFAQTGQITKFPDLPILIKPEIPSGQVPAACKQFMNVAGAETSLVNCYLSDPANAKIATSMEYWFNNGTDMQIWPQWPVWAKSDLVKRFADTVTWYKSGMNSYPGTLANEMPAPVNLAFVKSDPQARTAYDETTVDWPFYAGQVALNLAAEIYGWIPYSLQNYTAPQLGDLFVSRSFWYCDQFGVPGWCNTLFSTPANPITAFKFFKQHNLIGATRLQTVNRMLEWSRANLWHTGGAFTYAQMEKYFGYYGAPPVIKILQGTVTTDTDGVPDEWHVVAHHWTAGCGGTSGLYAYLFPAVGIPAWPVSSGTGHATVKFTGINNGANMYLSHGDDAYDAVMSSEAPITLLLINEPTYQSWFPANDPFTAEKNTGRRPIEISVQYPSSRVMDLYCIDQSNNLSHAAGNVYNKVYKNIYTVQELEQAGLWTRLNQKMNGYACAL